MMFLKEIMIFACTMAVNLSFTTAASAGKQLRLKLMIIHRTLNLTAAEFSLKSIFSASASQNIQLLSLLIL